MIKLSKIFGFLKNANKFSLYDINTSFGTVFYSQDGEDAVLSSFYSDRPNYTGFYVDIGALHPFRFSNTQYFYENRWHGINIDATPGSMKIFNQIRLRDINVETGISSLKKI